MIRKSSVLLLKTRPAEGTSDKYESILTEHNFEVKLIKTLDFGFKNLEVLKDLLEKPSQFSGLIFSSPRCVEATRLSLNSGTLNKEWSHKVNYVVGETTYKDVLDKLELDCVGKESGNAVNLSKIILANSDRCDKPFLFPHGNLKTDTLKVELNKQGLEIEGVCIYDTITNPELDKELLIATHNCTILPEFVVFFSPSGVYGCVDFFKKALCIDRVKFVAVGPVTAKAIEEAEINVYSVATKPTPQDILRAVKVDTEH